MPVNNKTKDILKIAENVLGAQVALAKKDNAAAVGMLREAVAVQDTLSTTNLRIGSSQCGSLSVECC